jgi:hypothetical protein
MALNLFDGLGYRFYKNAHGSRQVNTLSEVVQGEKFFLK